jgi:hypothetical protein
VILSDSFFVINVIYLIFAVQLFACSSVPEIHSSIYINNFSYVSESRLLRKEVKRVK